MDTSILLVIVAAIVLGIIGLVVIKRKKSDEDSIAAPTKIGSPINTEFIKVTKPHHANKEEVLVEEKPQEVQMAMPKEQNLIDIDMTTVDDGFDKTVVLSKVLPTPIAPIHKEPTPVVIDEVKSEPLDMSFTSAESNLKSLGDDLNSDVLEFTTTDETTTVTPTDNNAVIDLPEEPDLQGAHILLVDDSKLVRIKTEKFLVSNGYTVTTAIDGIDALEKMKNNEEYDIVITDIEMPNMDGFGLCKRIRENDFYEHTPIMVMSSHTNLHLELSSQSKINGFVPKPYNEQEMLDQIHFLVKK